MKPFHLLVSRFNWPHECWQTRPRSQYADWLSARCDLLEKYTAKSIRNCHVKPDLWVLLVTDCEFNFVPTLRNILRGLSYRLVFYAGAEINAALRSVISDLTFPAEIRTTRVDSDDLIAADFFSRLCHVQIQPNQAKAGVVLSFPGGTNYCVSNDEFYFSSYPDNPFLTLVEYLESPSDLRTVYWKQHTDLASSVPFAKYLRSFHPMWASVIHEGNFANQSLLSTNTVKLHDGAIIGRKFGITHMSGD